jgi:hypothetical protein
MKLTFSPRLGDHMNWRREVVVRVNGTDLGPYTLTMFTANGIRHGEARHPSGKIAWKGKCSPEPTTPLRAFAVAAGLCDEEGNSEITPPAWLK